MRAREAIVAAICVCAVMWGDMALGDGGMFFRQITPQYEDVYQPTQKVYIRWDGSQERLLVQTKYEGPAEEMVWIVPVPSEPTVQRADGAIFNDLSKLTYNPAIDYTDFIGLDVIPWTTSSGGTTGSSSGTVEWHERIGDYDVALLRPVSGDDVIQWLNTNDFAIPEAINPVLEDYVAKGWWMVAARIHPDALSAITSEKLAKGTLHPLEMTFLSSACVYPMRLTRMAAGSVEELIYIEGPAHYKPATLTDGAWEIDLFGGPVREVTQDYTLANLEYAAKILGGDVHVETSDRLTKLRRVFEPEEMTEDLVFQELDLASWIANDAPAHIAQAATQYGRWRDPNGIAPLVNALSDEALDAVVPAADEYIEWPSPAAKFLAWGNMQMWSWSPSDEEWSQYPGCADLRSCIWALGEIGIEHEIGQTALEKLLGCARHDNQFIRMEACIALAKARSERLGSILVDRLADVLCSGALPVLWTPEFWIPESELDLATDCVVAYGTTQQKDAYIDTLSELIADVNENTLYDLGAERAAPIAYNWPEWIVWRAACTQDQRLISVLEELRSRLSPDKVDAVSPFLLRAEAACGSADAIATAVQTIVDDQTLVLNAGQASGTGGIASLDNYYKSGPYSLRVQILQKRDRACQQFPMPAQAADIAIRSALSDETISDWYALYLLAEIKEPTDEDKETLIRIWNNEDEDQQLLVVGVLYAWSDVQTLMDLYSDAQFAEVKSEIAWALAELKTIEGLSILEEQVCGSWNTEWLSLGRSFIHPSAATLRSGYRDSTLPVKINRNEESLWYYFHPTSGILDSERLAALQRLTANTMIHAGIRFDLLGKVYGGTEWGLPLLEQAAREILAVDSSDTTASRINSMMNAVGNSGFVK